MRSVLNHVKLCAAIAAYHRILPEDTSADNFLHENKNLANACG